MSEPKANCPWCGCEPTTVEQGIAWGCGSYKKGIEPWQSQNCQLNVAEAKIERSWKLLNDIREEADNEDREIEFAHWVKAAIDHALAEEATA